MRIVLAFLVVGLVSAASAAFDPLKPVTMSFVIDTTGSMGNDIRQVRAGVRGILATNSALTQQIFVKYVVAPYNDPHVPRPLVTYNPSAVISYVNRLYPRGGGDCPELAMAGLYNAIRYSTPGSVVFFFSDANAKDVHRWRQVQNLALKNHITLVFVMTGCCRWHRGCYKFSYHVYKKLARATKGAYYRIPKNRVHYVLNFIRAAIKNGLPALRKLPPTFPALIRAIRKLNNAPCAKRPCKGKNVTCRNINSRRRSCTCNNPRARYDSRRGCRVPRPTTTTTTTTRAPPTPAPTKITCSDWNGNTRAVGSVYTVDCVTFKCLADGNEKEIRHMCSAGKTCKPVGSKWACKDDGLALTCTCMRDADGIYTLME